MNNGGKHVERSEQRKPAPTLRCADLRLGDDFGLEMTLWGDDGRCIIVSFTLEGVSPAGFDLELLRTAWERWRGGSLNA